MCRAGCPARNRRSASSRFTGQAVVVASGGIGGNLELVRAHWPTGWGDPPPTMITGVPDFVDGSMLAVTSRPVGG